MKQSSAARVLLAHPLRSAILLALTVFMAEAFVEWTTLEQDFAGQGNDDVMRMLSVRDWIAGQGWYDMAQYRLLPPDGVPLHWSRYLDVGIAALVVPLSFVVPMQTAEILAAALWPTLIMVLTVLAIGLGTKRVFGVIPACFSVICVAFWPLTADLHSRPGNLDHHNVQLLMMVILAFAVIWPERPVMAGIVGGIAAGFSLAIGLESLPFIVGAGLAFLIRAFFVPSQISRRLLFSFCAALSIGSVLFFMGQTAPSRWGQPVCDQLGPPTLALIAVAVIASIVPLLARRWLAGPWQKLAAAVVLTGLGAVAVWPLLAGCLNGPYGDLPHAIQEAISGRITEARPGLAFAQVEPVAALLFVVPVIIAFLAGVAYWLAGQRQPAPRSDMHHALGLLLILCVIGILMVQVQMRTVIMVASVVPIIGGLVAGNLLQAYLRNRDLLRGLAAIVIAALITSPGLAVGPLAPLLENPADEDAISRSDCLGYEGLTALNAVPPGVILTHLNFGPGLIWATHHDGLSAPYHRSARAMENGIVPFQLNSAEMASYVRATDATHLLICRGYDYDSDFADSLAMGGDADWLRAVPLSHDAQILFEVIRE